MMHVCTYKRFSATSTRCCQKQRDQLKSAWVRPAAATQTCGASLSMENGNLPPAQNAPLWWDFPRGDSFFRPCWSIGTVSAKLHGWINCCCLLMDRLMCSMTTCHVNVSLWAGKTAGFVISETIVQRLTLKNSACNRKISQFLPQLPSWPLVSEM